MHFRQFIGVPNIAAVALLALAATGCGNSAGSDGISTDSNEAEDAAVDDVLGGNDTSANDTRAP